MRKIPMDYEAFRLRAEAGATNHELAREFGCSRSTAQRLRAALGVPQLPRGARTGENHHRWKGGRRLQKRGYVKVLARDHPRADEQGYVLEHRLAMERHIDRLLDRKSVV